MLAKDILRIVLYGVGFSSLGAVIYLAGPFVAFGDWHPLENHIVRQIAILLLGAAAAGITGLHFFKRRKNAKEIADGVSGADQAVSDEPVLKERMATKSPQLMRIWPDDRQQRSGQTVEVELSDVGSRAVLLFNVSGDGTIQMLYPVGSDAALARSANLRLPLRVGEPFGAEQIVAVTSQQRMVDLETVLMQLNRRRASGQVIKSLERYLPADARIASIGFFSVP